MYRLKKGYILVFCIVVFGASVCDLSADFRDYPQDPSDPVYQHYYNMNTRQTLAYVLEKKREYSDVNSYVELSLEEALEKLSGFVDPSDPDCSFSNSIHNFQTAERCRKLMPDDDWFHLLGLIHDVGKILFMFGEPTWAIVGDTFPVGHPFTQNAVYSEFFKLNPDYGKPSTYQQHCGFDAVHFAWGHDEYLYHVLKNNNTSLPQQALYVVRYHSFYPFHSYDAYNDLANEYDQQMLKYIRSFNQCDLYSKSDDIIDYESIRPYYDKLIKKYLPEKIKFYCPKAYAASMISLK